MASRTAITSRITAAVAVAVASLSIAASAHATFPGQNGKIAGTGGSGDIYAINEDGTGQVQLTSAPTYEGQPAWSADGSRIAYVSSHCGGGSCTGAVWIMNADGSGQTQLTPESGSVSSPAWSPDGTKIAFHDYRPPDNGIFTMNPDGSDVSLLGPGTDPAWSPDGTKIAFTGPGEDPNDQFGFAGDIYVMDADGMNQRRLTFNGDRAPPSCGNYITQDESDTRPNWSPDGTRIVYEELINDPCLDGEQWSGVEMIDAAGGTERILSEACYGAAPIWSPDGQKILFAGCSGHYTIKPDGTGRTPSVGFWLSDWQPIVNHPPDCSGVSADPSVLWPANGTLRPVELSGASDPDGDAVSLEITGVTQDERVRGTRDAYGAAENAVRLRAKRDPRGDGRVYRIAFTATDAKGGQCDGTAAVSVPRHKKQPAVDSAPPSYNSLGR